MLNDLLIFYIYMNLHTVYNIYIFINKNYKKLKLIFIFLLIKITKNQK